MSSTKRELNLYSFYDHTGIARHLEEMAAKGWMLEKFSTNGLFRYRREDPRPVHYAVTYFPKASNFDPAPSEGQQEFTALCAAAGWEFVGQSFQMQIFRNEAVHPVPLDTEPAVQVENIHSAMKSNFLPGSAILMALSLLQIVMGCTQLVKYPLHTLASVTIFTPLLYLLLLLQLGIDVGAYFRWHKRARRSAAEEGRFLPTYAPRWRQVWLLTVLAVVLALYAASAGVKYLAVFGMILVVYFLAAGLSRLATRLMKRFHFSTGVNRFLTIALSVAVMLAGVSFMTYRATKGNWFLPHRVETETYEWHGATITVYHDDLPLSLEDLTGYDDYDYSSTLSQTSSLLLREITAYQRPSGKRTLAQGQPERLSYTLWASPFDAMLELAEAERTKNGGYTAIDPTPWGAEKAWQDQEDADCYLLRYETCLASITFDFSPTGEQMAITAEKLRNA